MNAAEWAWVIVGVMIALIVIISFLAMIPELTRYMKLKSM